MNPSQLDKFVSSLKCYNNINPKIVTCIGFNTPEARKNLTSQVQLPSEDVNTYGGPLNPRSHIYYTKGRPEMLFDLDYEIDDPKCRNICLLSQKVVINIPNQLINTLSKEEVVLNVILKQLLQFFKSKGYKKEKIYALLPKDIGGIDLDLLASHLKTIYNVNIIKSLKEQSLFDNDTVPLEKIKTALNSRNIRTPDAPMFNPMLCTDADVYERVVNWKEQQNFLTTSMIPLLESSLLQILHAINNNKKIQVTGQDTFNRLRGFAISDIYSILEMETLNFLYSKIIEKMIKSPEKPTASTIEKCIEEAIEHFINNSEKVLGKVSEETLNRIKIILNQTTELILNIPPNQLIKQQITENKRNKGIQLGLGITGMIRKPGKGNMQWYTNYQAGPLTITLGFANDLDLCNNNVPKFRIQPKVHLNVNV